MSNSTPHRFIVAGLACAVACLAAGAARAQSAGTDEFFGRVDLVMSGTPAPEVMSTRAVKGQHLHSHTRPALPAAPLAGFEAPVLFHVRPGEEARWAARCKAYNACDLPVLFVTEAWYRDKYLPHVSAQDGREQRYRAFVRPERNERQQRHRDPSDLPR